VDIATLKTRLTGAFVWLTILTAAAGFGFIFLISTMNGGFRDLNSRIGEVEKTAAAQTATLDAVKDATQRIEGKLDNVNSQAGNRAEQNSSVHQGTP
jgi:hypothetical protein